MSREEKREILSAITSLRRIARKALNAGNETKFMQFSFFADMAERKLLKR